MSFAFCVVASGCASSPPQISKSPPDTVSIVAVKNFAGVPLKFPSIYFGDALGKAEDIEIEKLDLLKLSRAALLSEFRARGYAACLSEDTAQPRWEIHAAVTCFDLDTLKSEGTVKLGLLIIIVDAREKTEAARCESTRKFKLLAQSPNEGGALGEARFVESKLNAFIEALAIDALTAAGL